MQGDHLRATAFDMAVSFSHDMDRTHVDGLTATSDLLLAYLRKHKLCLRR